MLGIPLKSIVLILFIMSSKLYAQSVYESTPRKDLNYKTNQRVLYTVYKTIDAFEEEHDQWSLTLRAILTERLHTSIVLGQKENVLQSFDGQRFSIRNITSARAITDEVIEKIGGMFFGRSEVDELNKKFSKN